MAESLLTLAQAADRSRSRRRHPTPSKDRRAHVLWVQGIVDSGMPLSVSRPGWGQGLARAPNSPP